MFKLRWANPSQPGTLRMVVEGEGELQWQGLESDSSYDGQTRRNLRCRWRKLVVEGEVLMTSIDLKLRWATPSQLELSVERGGG